MASMYSSESPDRAAESQSGTHMEVLGDIHIVIEVNESTISYLPKNSKDCNDEDQTNDKTLTCGGLSWAFFLWLVALRWTLGFAIWIFFLRNVLF
jgi:hypothetical protein